MNTKRAIKILSIALIVLIAIASISLGMHFNKKAKSNYAAGVVIDRVSDKLLNYIEIDPKYDLGDSFKVESNLSFSLDSEEYQKKKKEKEYLEKYNYIKNLNTTTTNLVLIQDRDQKDALITLNSKLPKEELINFKYLITNSTEYYLLPDVSKNYINNGTNNYFESLREGQTTTSNIKYLREFTLNSLKDNLLEEYFEKYQVSENINSKNMEVNQISLKIDDKKAHEIVNNVLRDLENDQRSKEILTGIYKDIFKFKIKDSKEILKKKESYTINIYTSKYLNRFLKLEVVHLNGDIKKTYSFVGDINRGNLYYIENDKTVYDMKINSDSKKIEINIKNSSDAKIGNLKIEKEDDGVYFTFSFDDDKKKYDLIYSSKYTEYKKNKSFKNEKKLSFKYLKDKVGILSGNVSINSSVSTDFKIDKDISNSVLASTLTDIEKEKYNNKLQKIDERLKK